MESMRGPNVLGRLIGPDCQAQALQTAYGGDDLVCRQAAATGAELALQLGNGNQDWFQQPAVIDHILPVSESKDGAGHITRQRVLCTQEIDEG
jgi:hypothetical protein